MELHDIDFCYMLPLTLKHGKGTFSSMRPPWRRVYLNHDKEGREGFRQLTVHFTCWYCGDKRETDVEIPNVSDAVTPQCGNCGHVQFKFSGFNTNGNGPWYMKAPTGD